MTTGNVSVGNWQHGWSRNWSGGDGTKGHHNVDHNYTVTWARWNTISSYYPWPACNANYSNYVSCGLRAVPFVNGDLAALSRLSQAVKGHGFNAGTFLATSPQLVRQTLSTLSAVGGALIDLRRGNLVGALQNLGMVPGQRAVKHMRGKLLSGDVSGTWLAMQYGWLPTLSDLYDSAVAFSVLNGGRRRTTFRSSFANSKKDNNAGGSPTNYSCFAKSHRAVYYKYTLTDNPSVARSLGLTDPASMIWEVLPWSFVVDWFIPIGTFLETANLLAGVTGHWVKSDVERRSSSFTGYKNPLYKCGSADYEFLCNLTRTVGDGSLSVPLPRYNGNTPFNLSGKRILNAIALIHQRLV